MGQHMKTLKTGCKELILFCIGGASYILIEIIWRGYSHWTMFILGGICFILIGGINNYIDWNMKLWKQMILGSLSVTIAEFITGCILNLGFHMHTWDYSRMPFNLFGQICLAYTILWFFLSLLAIWADDIIRWQLFGEEKPHYRL